MSIINTAIGSYQRLKWRPATHRELAPEWEERFSEWGEGMYTSNIASRNNDLPSKLISRFAGKLSHSIAILHSNDLSSWFTRKQWQNITDSWDAHYGHTKKLNSSITTIVLASADKVGMVYSNFSSYERRELSIRKPPISMDDQLKVAQWLANIHAAEYDYTGFVFWLLYRTCIFFRFLEDPESWMCSENVYIAFKHAANYLLTSVLYPSPDELEAENKDIRIYNTLPKEYQ
jgi:hypothetical protein